MQHPQPQDGSPDEDRDFEIAPGDIAVEWLTDPHRLPEITALFLSAVHPHYISHGDIMEGRAEGPGRWSEDLREIHAAEISHTQLESGPFVSPGMRLAIATDGEILLGFAAVAYVQFDARGEAPVHYARIDDIVVAPDARRRGVGSRLITWVEQQLHQSGIRRVFLESGINNHGAHQFFERHGFSVTSVTMLKDL